MNKTLLIFGAAVVAGYFLADTLKPYQPFTTAFVQGAKIAS